MGRTKQTVPKRRVGGLGSKVGVVAPAEGGEKRQRKPHRFRQGTVALREIRRYQKSVDLLIPRSPIRRLIRELAGPIKEDLRFTRNAFEALHEAAECYLTQLFDDANVCALEHNRRMVTARDMRLVFRIRRDSTLPQDATLTDKAQWHSTTSGGGKSKSKRSKSKSRKNKSTATISAAAVSSASADVSNSGAVPPAL